VQRFIDGIPPEAVELILALRGVVRRTVPNAAETVVWGCLSYHRPSIGGRVKGAVCQIQVKNGAVRLDFIHGVRILDPRQLLEGKGVSKRYVPIVSTA
jgi:hypothetical protein